MFKYDAHHLFLFLSYIERTHVAVHICSPPARPNATCTLCSPVPIQQVTSGVVGGIPWNMTNSKIFTVTAHNSGGNSSTKVRIGVHPFLALHNIGAFNLPSNQNITPISTVATACVALFEPGPFGAKRLRFNVTPPLPPGPVSRLVLNRSTGIISGSSSMFFESTKKSSR